MCSKTFATMRSAAITAGGPDSYNYQARILRFLLKSPLGSPGDYDVNFSGFSAILDIIFGLIFTYFLLALVASGIQEIIASVFAWRGTYLSKGIDVILDNSSAARFAWVDFRDRLRAHFTPNPGQTVAEQLEQQIRQKQQGNATADQAVLLRVLNVQTHPLMRNVPTTLPSYVPARNFSLALLETLRDGSKTPLFSQAERTVAALPEGDLKKTLSLFLEDAGGDLDAFRAHLEHWFDDAMDRVSGIYTRLSQVRAAGSWSGSRGRSECGQHPARAHAVGHTSAANRTRGNCRQQ